MRSITCTNNDGSSMTFDSFGFSPFILAHIDGIYEHQIDVIISKNTMIDGGTYQGSVTGIRNIVITLLDKPTAFYNHYNRSALYVLFSQGKKGTLTYNEDGISRKIDYYVESISQNKKKTMPITISLLCPDPFFYDVSDTTVHMANWIAGWEFVHMFQAEGEEFGYRSTERLKNIVNDSAADNIGITITMTAIGPVVNPSATRVESDTSINIGNANRPFNMVADDILTITTGIGDKHVYLTRNGVMQEVNEYLTEDSEFIQLMRGNNNIGYSADSGETNLVVAIKYRFKYDGV